MANYITYARQRTDGCAAALRGYAGGWVERFRDELYGPANASLLDIESQLRGSLHHGMTVAQLQACATGIIQVEEMRIRLEQKLRLLERIAYDGI